MLHYDATKREVSILKKLNLPIGTLKVLGHGLAIFFDQLTDLLAPVDATVFVREKAVISHIADTDRLLRVGGVADVALWQVKHTGWYELAPSTVKRIVTGKGPGAVFAFAGALAGALGKAQECEELYKGMFID